MSRHQSVGVLLLLCFLAVSGDLSTASVARHGLPRPARGHQLRGHGLGTLAPHETAQVRHGAEPHSLKGARALIEAARLEEEDDEGMVCGGDPDAVDTDACQRVSPEKVTAVSMRVLKTGYAVTVGLVAIGAITTSGPIGPALMLSGAIIFMTYSYIEKNVQKLNRSLLKSLTGMMLSLDRSLQACLSALRGLMLVLSNYRSLAALLKVADDQVESCQLRAANLGWRDVEGVMRELESKTQCMRAQVEQLQARATTAVAGINGLLKSLIDDLHDTGTLMRNVADAIFDEGFTRAMERWDKVLAAVAVTTATVDLTHAGELVAELHEHAAPAVMEFMTTAIHASEARELVPEGVCGSEEDDDDDCAFEDTKELVASLLATVPEHIEEVKAALREEQDEPHEDSQRMSAQGEYDAGSSTAACGATSLSCPYKTR